MKPYGVGSGDQQSLCTEGKSLMPLIRGEVRQERERPRGDAFSQAEGNGFKFLLVFLIFS